MLNFAIHLLWQVWLNHASTHQAYNDSSEDESDSGGDDDEDEGSEEEEELWKVEKVLSVKYFNTKKRKGWHAFVDWEGDWPASYHPFKDLFGSSCK